MKLKAISQLRNIMILITKFQVFTLLSAQRWYLYWKAVSIQECFNEYVNKEQRIELDSEDDEEPDNIEDEQESFQVTPREALAIIDRLVHTSGISNDDQNALFGIKKNLEIIV